MNKGVKMLLTVLGLGGIVYLVTKAKSKPTYPNPGTETILNEPGHYIGWFEALPPGYGTSYDFVPSLDWVILSYEYTGEMGTHGGARNSVMTKVELVYQA